MGVVWLTVRSLYKDIETLSPRKSRAHRRKTRQAQKAAASPTPVPTPATHEMPVSHAAPTLLVIIDGPLGRHLRAAERRRHHARTGGVELRGAG